LLDRSSAPRRVWNRTDPVRVEVILKLRRLRMTSAEIAETLAMPLSTVSGILTRLGLGRLDRARTGVRYERSRPGELVHLDVKRLGRIEGGAGKRVPRGSSTTRPSAAPMLRASNAGASVGNTSTSPSTMTAASPTPRCYQTKKAVTAARFLVRATRFSHRYGISVERVLTDG
jgi:hypothetical protein